MSLIHARHFLDSVKLMRERIPSMEVYPYNIPAVRMLEEVRFHPAVTFFMGDNGTGKSTIVEALAGALKMNAEGGSSQIRFATHANSSALHSVLRAIRPPNTPKELFFLRAESVYNVASELERLLGPGKMYNNYRTTSLHGVSHGESFLAIVRHRFRPRGLYILDEPESALSPQRQLVLMGLMHGLIRAGSQFIVATHSPILSAYPNSRIYRLDAQGIHLTEWEDTETVRVTRDFLANPAPFLDEVRKYPPAVERGGAEEDDEDEDD